MFASSGWFLVMLPLVCSAAAASATAVDRDARGWFDGSTRTLTSLITETRVVTERIPSSCVVVQASLPPCRHLRAIENIQPTQSVRVLQTAAPPSIPGQNGQGWRPIINPSSSRPGGSAMHARRTPPIARSPNSTTAAPSSFWSNWNIFGSKEVTVTQTIREVFTTKFMDPKTVVTFSVKGCKPTRLPFDLPECEPPRTVIETSTSSSLASSSTASPVSLKTHQDPGLIVMAPIQLVPNMAPIIMPDLKETTRDEAPHHGDEAEKEVADQAEPLEKE